MSLYIFKSQHLDNLRVNIPTNLEKYKSNTVWATLPDGADSIKTNMEFRQPVTLHVPAPDSSVATRSENDFDNAVILHQSLPNLNRLQAQDHRLWVRFSHVELWEYMRRRWPIEGYDNDKRKGRILERYFVSNSSSRALMRQGISRLWWGAFLTYDESRTDPYELTRVLFSKLDIAQTFLERSLGRAPKILHSVLQYILDNQDSLDGNTGRDKIRNCAKYLNQVGGITLLDCYNQPEVLDRLNQV
jgi:hypothetical protein